MFLCIRNPDVKIGESYAGMLPIDSTGKRCKPFAVNSLTFSGKELFFWFVPTTNPAAKNEITLWLNGGPGCSSLDGMFNDPE